MSGVITGPDLGVAAAGTVNLPTGAKDTGRVDFRDTEFDKLVEQQGIRLAWSRGSACPCQGANDQTRGPGINCPLCKENPGFVYFRPPGFTLTEAEHGEMDDIQKFIVDRATSPSVIIRGVVQAIGRTENTYDRLGNWVDGVMSVSVRKDNILGYYDRLVAIDQLGVYSELVLSGPTDGPTKLRFPAVRVDFVRSESQLYTSPEDYFINAQGQLCWQTGRAPAQGTQLAVTYVHHPQFLVWEHLHFFRGSTNNTKLGRTPKTPLGDPQLLPRQALVKLEFLIGRGTND